MTLNKPTKYGLTFGQILSVIGLFGSILTVFVSLNVRVAQAEIRIEQLEKGHIETSNTIMRIHEENRQDHKELMKKLDDIILRESEKNKR